MKATLLASLSYGLSACAAILMSETISAREPRVEHDIFFSAKEVVTCARSALHFITLDADKKKEDVFFECYVALQPAVKIDRALLDLIWQAALLAEDIPPEGPLLAPARCLVFGDRGGGFFSVELSSNRKSIVVCAITTTDFHLGLFQRLPEVEPRYATYNDPILWQKLYALGERKPDGKDNHAPGSPKPSK